MGISNSRIACLVPLASAAVVIPRSQWSSDKADIPVAEIPNYRISWDDFIPKVTFDIPCPECQSDHSSKSDEQALTFEFKAFPAQVNCGYANITLNGESLSQSWNGPRGSGQGTVSSTLSNNLLSSAELDLVWETSCLFEDDNKQSSPDPAAAAQVVTVFVNAVNGRPLKSNSGFTLSYKQLDSSELLKLDLVPNPRASDQEFSEAWRNPSHNLSNALNNFKTEVLQFSGHGKHFEDFTHDLDLLEAEAASLFELIREKKSSLVQYGKTKYDDLVSELEKCEDNKCKFSLIGGKFLSAGKHIFKNLIPTAHPTIHSPTQQLTLSPESEDTDESSTTSHSHGESKRPRPTRSPSEGTSPQLSLNGSHEEFSHTLVLIHAAGVVAVIITVGTIFVVIRANCCTLRQRADRRARREERRAAKEYRRLANRQAWRDWWTGIDRRRIQNYEEKRALILQQEAILEAAMQAEIRLLREAHGMVDSMVRAEEGRLIDPSLHHHNFSMRRSDSLPDYRSEASTEPPPYGEEYQEFVANGFRQYNSSSIQYTPGSSIIGISPRPSCETLRRPGEFCSSSGEESETD